MLLVVGAGGETSQVSRDVNSSAPELAGKHITHETPIKDSRDIRLVKSSNTKGP
jgi:hypothetical protein